MKLDEVDEVRENDHVFLKRQAAQEFTDLATKMAIGGRVERIDANGVAEVRITVVEKIHITKLTTLDPIP